MKHVAKMRTPFALLGLESNGQALTSVTFLPLGERALAPSDNVTEQAAREIERYLSDPQFRFTVPLAAGGTAFQHRVWTALCAIPSGESRTYGDVARTVQSAARAVGQACGANPIGLIVPCHRVVAATGSLGGFMNAQSGEPLAVKRWLLGHEGYRFGA